MSILNRVILKETILALGLLCSLLAHAQVSELNCDRASDDLVKVKTRLSDDERRQYMDSLYADIIRIIEYDKSPPPGSPSNFIRRCFQAKRDAFNANLENASGALRESFEAYYKRGMILENMGKLKDALNFYEAAMKMREDDPDVRLKYFRVWREVNRMKFHVTKASGLSSVNFEDFLREFNRILEPILRMDKATNAHKIQALKHRVSVHSESIQPKLIMQDYEAILQLDPADKDALEAVVAYYCDVERFNPVICKKYLESYVSKYPENRLAALQLIKLQYDEGDTSGALLVSKRFLDYLPNDPDFMAWRAKVLWKVGRHEESQLLSNAVLMAHPDHPVALSTRVRTLLMEAEGYEKRGLLSNALKSLEDALAIVKKAGIENTTEALDINERMAFIIYDFLRSQNFKETKATRADAKRIVELLSPSFRNARLRRNTSGLVETFFHAIELSNMNGFVAACKFLRQYNIALSSSPRAMRACSRHEVVNAPIPPPVFQEKPAPERKDQKAAPQNSSRKAIQ